MTRGGGGYTVRVPPYDWTDEVNVTNELAVAMHKWMRTTPWPAHSDLCGEVIICLQSEQKARDICKRFPTHFLVRYLNRRLHQSNAYEITEFNKLIDWYLSYK
jgi:hypothetical protein